MHLANKYILAGDNTAALRIDMTENEVDNFFFVLPLLKAAKKNF